ncbi:hypothetical protein D3C86_1302710 [compost metagenome]
MVQVDGAGLHVVGQAGFQRHEVDQDTLGALGFDRVSQDDRADFDVVLGSFQADDLDLGQIDGTSAGHLAISGEPEFGSVDGSDQLLAAGTARHTTTQQTVHVQNGVDGRCRALRVAARFGLCLRGCVCILLSVGVRLINGHVGVLLKDCVY